MFRANGEASLNFEPQDSTVQHIIGRVQEVHDEGATVRMAVLDGVGISDTHLQIQFDTGLHNATASLKKGSLIQVEGAELKGEGAAVVRLTESRGDKRQVPTWKLSLLAADYSVIASMSSRSADYEWSTPSSSNRLIQMGDTANTIGMEKLKSKYTSIDKLLSLANLGAVPTGNIRLFAIVVDCTAPCATNRGDFWCEVVVADDSSSETPHADEGLKTISIQCREKDPAHCIPFRAIGDIICIESLKVDFRLSEKRVNLQAYTDRDTNILLWAQERRDFKPVLSKRGVQLTPSLNESISFVHNRISRTDQERIQELRSYSLAYVINNSTSHRPNVRTVVDVNASFATDKSGSGFVDLLCCYVEDCKPDTQSNSYRFTVSHGLSLMTEPDNTIVIDSQLLKRRDDSSKPSFSDYYPSWESMSRSKTCPFWLLIRDLKLSAQGHGLIGLLSVELQTSTLIWYPEGSALVRSCLQRSFGSAHERSKLYQHSPRTRTFGTQPLPAAIRIKKGRTPSQGQHATTARRVKHSTASPSRNSSRPRSSQPRSASLKRQPHPNQNRRQRATQRKPVARSNANQTLPVAGGFQANRIRIVPTPEQLRSRPPRSRMLLNTTVITSHSFQQLKICSLAELREIASSEVVQICRIRVSAKGCVAPRDVRFACKPWCVRCKRFLKIDSNDRVLQCLGCDDTFSSTGDPRTEWAYFVRLILEDEQGDRVESWIEGNEGIEFFSEFPPQNLLSNLEARQAVKNYLTILLKQTSVIDCCVVPQDYEDVTGKLHKAFKVVGTRLIPGLLEET
eukprot:GFKZ01011915.1.p1 GENE.GFKZ01011915.1~~GFKZ01011915.1.p1  ORF type:complete len:794 (-),score=62.27 GFKZ01011915.1:14-2395(-)